MAILLIHTGGTIAMKQGPAGLEPGAGVLETGLAALQKRGIPGCAVALQRLEPLIDSANATFRDWNRIAAAIAGGDHAGYVVTHGTDTMAFTAAALCFALGGLTRPVIMTGSMLPFGAENSDAGRNLADALIAARAAPAGVWLQFAGRLLHGARIRKTHSHQADAFDDSPSDAPPLLPGPPARTQYHAPQLAIVTLAPNTSIPAIAAVLQACDGVVLRVFGSGTIPNDAALRQALIAATERGVLMIAVSQSPLGGVSLGSYAASAPLIAAGVIDGGRITAEAAYAKLAHVLSHDAGYSAQRARLCQDLAGET